MKWASTGSTGRGASHLNAVFFPPEKTEKNRAESTLIFTEGNEENEAVSLRTFTSGNAELQLGTVSMPFPQEHTDKIITG